jgi:hypothetical protein
VLQYLASQKLHLSFVLHMGTLGDVQVSIWVVTNV